MQVVSLLTSRDLAQLATPPRFLEPLLRVDTLASILLHKVTKQANLAL